MPHLFDKDVVVRGSKDVFVRERVTFFVSFFLFFKDFSVEDSCSNTTVPSLLDLVLQSCTDSVSSSEVGLGASSNFQLSRST